MNILQYIRGRTPQIRQFLFWVLFPAAAFIWEEMVFSLSVGAPSGSRLYLIGWSAAAGFLLAFVTLVFPKRLKIFAMGLLLGLASIPWIVEFFVYRAFKILYDVNTITGGAGGAVGQFGDQIIELLTCRDGIIHLALFLFPVIVWCLAARLRKIPQPDFSVPAVFLLLNVSLLLYLSTEAAVKQDEPALRVYGEEYSYEQAVNRFGLLTGIRLDLEHSLSPEKNAEFSFASVNEPCLLEETEITDFATPDNLAAAEGDVSKAGPAGVEEPEKEPEQKTGKPKEYGKNVLPIDFEALSAGASDQERQLDAYVMSLAPSSKNEMTGLFRGKNLILLSAEAFSGFIIDEKLTPALWRLSEKGIRFTDYYQPASAGTTGGEYEILFGMLPMSGGKSLKKTASWHNRMTIASMLDKEGYFGKAYHNNDYRYYDRHKTHVNLGYSEGFMGMGNGMEQYVQKAWPESDLEMLQGTVPEYIDQSPFNIYYMTVSGHSNYSVAGNDMTEKNWDRVKDLECSDDVKAYIAANLELEDALAWLLEALEEKGIADDTVICMSADHFPYGLDHDASLGKMPFLSELYGEDVRDYLTRDKNRLILWCGSLEKEEPITVDTPVSSIDILPTLLNLFGCEWDSRLLPGRDVFSDAEPLVFDIGYDWKTDKGKYLSSTGRVYPLEGEEITKEEEDRIRQVIKNKINYCKGLLATDYFYHLFPDEPETEEPEETEVPEETGEPDNNG